MMRLWAESYAKKPTALPSATLSIVAHGVLIGAAVLTTLPAPNVASDTIANRVIYIPPPDRVSGQQGQRETVHYVTGPIVGNGSGDGPRSTGDEPPVIRDITIGRAPPADSANAPPVPTIVAPPDSVFSVLDVDTAVVRSANSAAPAYPLKLLQAHIMGTVMGRYVVDTTGFADSASFVTVSATNPEFETAVRAALPYMRFTPAKIGKTKVRQVVEQSFTFRIAADTVAKPVPPKRP